MLRKRFVYIAQYFSPEPYLKDALFIQDIKNKGWDPIVITSFPNYPKGRIFAGYKNRLLGVEQSGGVTVIRVLTYAYHGLNPFKRIFNYLVFSIFASLAVLKYGRSNNMYYILQSSPFVILIAWTIRLFKWKSKILLDIQDLFPENIRISGFIKFKAVLRFIDFCLNKFYYRSFDLFIVVSNGFKKILITKNVPEDKIETVFNWAMVEQDTLTQTTGVPVFDNCFMNIVYAGNIGVHQGLSKLVNGFNKLGQMPGNIKVHFFGDGTDFEVLKEALKDNSSVLFHGRISSEEVTKYLASADILFLHLVKDPVYENIIPSKLQTYIQVGRPILAGLEGEAKAIVIENNLGETFEPENTDDFLTAISRISEYNDATKDAIAKRSHALYNSVFSRKAGVEKIDRFLSRL